MIRVLGHLFRNREGTAIVEAAIFAPIFLLMTLGITDLGTGMFVRMQVNAGTQAGAAYAIVNKCATACLANIKAAINDATGNSSFCSSNSCTASLGPCAADASTTCIVVSLSYGFSPLLPDSLYTWAQTMTLSNTATIRIL